MDSEITKQADSIAAQVASECGFSGDDTKGDFSCAAQVMLGYGMPPDVVGSVLTHLFYSVALRDVSQQSGEMARSAEPSPALPQTGWSEEDVVAGSAETYASLVKAMYDKGNGHGGFDGYN